MLEYLLRYLKEEGDYRNVEKTAARAARLSPNEGWEIWQTDSLIALGRHKEAGKVYQQIAEHAQEMGGFLSQKQQTQLREVGSRIHQPEGTEKDIGRCLMESGVPEGAYACTLLGFLDCFRMLKRALARGGYCGLCPVPVHHTGCKRPPCKGEGILRAAGRKAAQILSELSAQGRHLYQVQR